MVESAGFYRPASLTPFYTNERCFIAEFLNTPRCEDVSVAEARVAPGVTTQLHSLSIAERYIVQQGGGIMELHVNETFALSVGDCVLIPADCAQRIKNTGDEDLVFLCICTPRFQPEHYKNLENSSTPKVICS